MDVAELRGIFLFAGLTDDQLGELIAISDEVAFDVGTPLFKEGDPADYWWVLLEGRVELLRRAGQDEAVLGAMDRPGVWAGGFRAFDDSSSYLATARAAGPGRYLRVPAEGLGDLMRAWFPFSVHLIGGFFQTVRRMDALSRQRESLIALGRLAAGLAHEINNPASATARAVDSLQETCDTLLASLTQLAERSFTAEGFVAIDTLRREIDAADASTDPLSVSDREDALYTWLETRGVESAWRIAPALAAAGVEVAWCEQAFAVLGDDKLEPGLEWVAATVASQALLSEAKESTKRVTALSDSVKSYSQLDRAELQSIDVTDGIESTLTMMAHKLGSGIEVVRDYGADGAQIEANAGELNQVWTNLIDNAIDAMDGQGTLRISTRVAGDDFVVEIADSGPGMPADVAARIFEPFFTTKDVGKGTGLGLDISRRIVTEHHQGQIKVTVNPGETVLSVRLPRRRS